MGANSSQFCPAMCCDANEEEQRALHKSRLNSRHPKLVLTTTAENGRHQTEFGSRINVRVFQIKSDHENMHLNNSSQADQPEDLGSPIDCHQPYSQVSLATASPAVTGFCSPPFADIIPGKLRTDGEVRRKHSPWVEQFLGSSRDAAFLRLADSGTPSSPPVALCQGAIFVRHLARKPHPPSLTPPFSFLLFDFALLVLHSSSPQLPA